MLFKELRKCGKQSLEYMVNHSCLLDSAIIVLANYGLTASGYDLHSWVSHI